MKQEIRPPQSINITSSLIFVITLFALNEALLHFFVSIENLVWYKRYYFILLVDALSVLLLGVIHQLKHKYFFIFTYVLLFFILYMYFFKPEEEINYFICGAVLFLYTGLFVLMANVLYSLFDKSYNKVWSIPIAFLSMLASIGITYKIVIFFKVLEHTGVHQYTVILIHFIFGFISMLLTALLYKLIPYLSRLG